MNEPNQPDSAGAGFKPQGRRFECLGLDAIDTAALEAFDYQYPGKEITITTATEEFTSLCPFSGMPDFGKLTLSCVPDRKCVELRSLKYYLMSYRMVGIFYEHIANRILEDLVGLLAPRRMRVVCDFTIRGGLQTTISAEYEKPATPETNQTP